MRGYKLFRKMKDGYAPLFIDATNRLHIGDAQKCKTDLEKKGFAKRIGWHCCYKPFAPHLTTTPKNGAQRVWVEVEVSGWVNNYERPECQGGMWFTCEEIKLVRELTENDVSCIINNTRARYDI